MCNSMNIKKKTSCLDASNWCGIVGVFFSCCIYLMLNHHCLVYKKKTTAGGSNLLECSSERRYYRYKATIQAIIACCPNMNFLSTITLSFFPASFFFRLLFCFVFRYCTLEKHAPTPNNKGSLKRGVIL